MKFTDSDITKLPVRAGGLDDVVIDSQVLRDRIDALYTRHSPVPPSEWPDPDKLRLLALHLDTRDDRAAVPIPDTPSHRQVQADLRRIADELEENPIEPTDLEPDPGGFGTISAHAGFVTPEDHWSTKALADWRAKVTADLTAALPPDAEVVWPAYPDFPMEPRDRPDPPYGAETVVAAGTREVGERYLEDVRAERVTDARWRLDGSTTRIVTPTASYLHGLRNYRLLVAPGTQADDFTEEQMEYLVSHALRPPEPEPERARRISVRDYEEDAPNFPRVSIPRDGIRFTYDDEVDD
jgi:hypothetical protein